MKKMPKTQEDADELRETGAPEPALHLRPPRLVGREGRADHRRLRHRPLSAAARSTPPSSTTSRRSRRTSRPTTSRSTSRASRSWSAGCIKHAFEILAYVVATVVVIFLLLWAYFRRWHGVVDPVDRRHDDGDLGPRLHGLDGHHLRPLDPRDPDDHHRARRLAHRADGRALLRRLRGDAAALRRSEDARASRSRPIAMGELIVPGTLGIFTDVAGLLVIMVTTIPQMYDLGLFGAFWVTSILVTVEILHPIMICYMPAPTEHEHFLPAFMVRFMRGVGWATTHPTWKYVIGGVTVVLLRRPRPTSRSSTRRSGRSTPGHAAAVAEPRIQRRDRADREALRRRRLAGGLLRRRPPERQRRRGADQGDGAVRALAARSTRTSAPRSRWCRSCAASGR